MLGICECACFFFHSRSLVRSGRMLAGFQPASFFEQVEYVNIGYWHHDLACMPRGGEAAMKGGLYRPPANFSILVHNLKKGGFRFAHARMQRHMEYDDAACRADTLARIPCWPLAPPGAPRNREDAPAMFPCTTNVAS